MRTLDFNMRFKDFRGTETGGRTIAEEMAMALFNAGIPELPVDREDKFTAYKISTKLIANSGVIELSEQDITFLRTFSCIAFSAGACGQILDLLEEERNGTNRSYT